MLWLDGGDLQTTGMTVCNCGFTCMCDPCFYSPEYHAFIEMVLAIHHPIRVVTEVVSIFNLL